MKKYIYKCSPYTNGRYGNLLFEFSCNPNVMNPRRMAEEMAERLCDPGYHPSIAAELYEEIKS